MISEAQVCLLIGLSFEETSSSDKQTSPIRVSICSMYIVCIVTYLLFTYVYCSRQRVARIPSVGGHLSICSPFVPIQDKRLLPLCRDI